MEIDFHATVRTQPTWQLTGQVPIYQSEFYNTTIDRKVGDVFVTERPLPGDLCDLTR